MSRKLLPAVVLLATLAFHHTSAQSAATEATDCRVQEDINMLVCTALGAQYSVTGDVDSPVDLSNPPTSYSTCEALDPDGDTLYVVCAALLGKRPS